MQTGAKKGVRRPTLEEVEQAMVTVLSSFSHEHHVTLNLSVSYTHQTLPTTRSV